MTDQSTGDQPWNQSGAFSPTPPVPAKPPRQKRQQKTKAPEPTAEKPAKKVRKPREEKPERRAPETVKVTLKEYATMVSAEPQAFLKAHAALVSLSKGVRVKVLAELQKVLG